MVIYTENNGMELYEMKTKCKWKEWYAIKKVKL